MSRPYIPHEYTSTAFKLTTVTRKDVCRFWTKFVPVANVNKAINDSGFWIVNANGDKPVKINVRVTRKRCLGSDLLFCHAHNKRRWPWCNGCRRSKWTWRHEFKSWTGLIAFHIALLTLGKVWIQLFSLELWVNSRADWVLQPWWGN